MADLPSSSENLLGKIWKHTWWAIPIVAILASYAVMPTAGFFWDDYDLILASPLVNGYHSFVEHFTKPFWSSPLLTARSFYRPLVSLSYALDHQLWQTWAGGYHLTNLFLHATCTLLLLALCLRAGASRIVACLLATAFAVFPRLSESVAWISGRTDSAAGIGSLGALLLYKPGEGYWGRKLLAGVALLFGLLCKEVALSAAVALILLTWQASPRPRRVMRLLIQLSPVWAALAIYATLRFQAMAGHHPVVVPIQRSVSKIFLTATEAIFRYVWMVVDAHRPQLQIGDVDHSEPLLSVLGVGIVLVGGVFLTRWSRRWNSEQWAAFGLGGTAIALVLHVIRLDVNVVAADRFLYFPLTALAILVAPTLERAWQRKQNVVLIGSLTVIGSFMVATSLHARTWTNEIALWRSTVKQSNSNALLPNNELSIALMKRSRYDEALAIFNRITASEKVDVIAINKATCLDRLNRRDEAIRLLEQLLHSNPNRMRAHVVLMLMHARDRRFAEARAIGSRLKTKLSDELDIQNLVKRIDGAEAEWAKIPRDDSVESLALRAAWFERLGAMPEAQECWNQLVKNDRADPALRLRAAKFIAQNGRAPEVRLLFHALANDGVLAAHLPTLHTLFDVRFDEG
jgi:tetratricopeptide (TPR) repeat protein